MPRALTLILDRDLLTRYTYASIDFRRNLDLITRPWYRVTCSWEGFHGKLKGRPEQANFEVKRPEQSLLVSGFSADERGSVAFYTRYSFRHGVVQGESKSHSLVSWCKGLQRDN